MLVLSDPLCVMFFQKVPHTHTVHTWYNPYSRASGQHAGRQTYLRPRIARIARVLYIDLTTHSTLARNRAATYVK